MMACQSGILLQPHIKWSDEANYLSEFVRKYPLPIVAKVTKGHYLNIGSAALPNPNLSQYILLHSSCKRMRIAAQCVKFKDNRKVVTIGPKLSIPINYDGWFEILSEDGRSAKCIETIAELAKRFPDTCLVRENIKAYLGNDDSDVITEKVKVLLPGEQLVLVSEVVGNAEKYRDKGKAPPRFLRCFDSQGNNVYLNFEQRGKFSAIAKEENISGVHNIPNLLKKRLPIMVRLVHGAPPIGKHSHFVHEMRLLNEFEEECVMIYPLNKEGNVIAVPINTPLKLLIPTNMIEIQRHKEFLKLTEKCSLSIMESVDRIHIFEDQLSIKESRVQLTSVSRNREIIRSLSIPSHICIEETESINLSDKNFDEDLSYQEIDQIYDYVRGIVPLPPEINKSDVNTDANKPEPPPVETIPNRRRSMDHLPDYTGLNGNHSNSPPKIITNNINNNRLISNHSFHIKSPPAIHSKSRRHSKPFLHSKSSPTFPNIVNQSPPNQIQITRPSNLFNLRYKSLNNLPSSNVPQTPDQSSGSGSKHSGNGSRDSLERNPKHKSLTNLVDQTHTDINFTQQFGSQDGSQTSSSKSGNRPQRHSMLFF